MCLVTNSFKPFIAKEKIPVYKVIDIDGFPPYFGINVLGEQTYRYKPGLNTADGPVKVERSYFGNTFSVSSGYLHAYNTYVRARVLAKSNAFDGKRTFRVIKMYIPKGTKYYVDEDCGEICSSELFWDKNDQF